jgi:hypothetical protein
MIQNKWNEITKDQHKGNKTFSRKCVKEWKPSVQANSVPLGMRSGKSKSIEIISRHWGSQVPFPLGVSPTGRMAVKSSEHVAKTMKEESAEWIHGWQEKVKTWDLLPLHGRVNIKFNFLCIWKYHVMTEFHIKTMALVQTPFSVSIYPRGERWVWGILLQG